MTPTENKADVIAADGENAKCGWEKQGMHTIGRTATGNRR